MAGKPRKPAPIWRDVMRAERVTARGPDEPERPVWLLYADCGHGRMVCVPEPPPRMQCDHCKPGGYQLMLPLELPLATEYGKVMTHGATSTR